MRPLRPGLALLLPCLGALLATDAAHACSDMQKLLLVPDSASARIMAFDAATGQIVDLDYIVDDAMNPVFSLPFHAIGAGNQILVSDQDADVVHQFDATAPVPLTGPPYVGVFAPPGGADPTVLDNVRGIAIRDEGSGDGPLLVAVGGAQSQFQDGVVRFLYTGELDGAQVAPGLGGLDSPFGVLVDGDRLLVSGGTSQRIHAYQLPGGTAMADFAIVSGFPQQLAIASNGNILVAGFSGVARGIAEYRSDGTLVRLITPNLASLDGFRGVAEIENPELDLLVTSTNGVYRVQRSDGTILETLIETDDTTTVSPRFIGRCEGPLGTTLLEFRIE